MPLQPAMLNEPDHQQPRTKGRSVFRYVLARGLVVLLVVLGLGVLATASLYQQARSKRILADEVLPVFMTSARLYGNTNTLSGLSIRLLATETRSELRTLTDRITDRSHAIVSDIDLLERQGLGRAEAERVRQVHAELVDGSETLAAIMEQVLTLRGAQDLTELMVRRNQLVQRQEMVASEMTTLVSGLARRTEQQVESHQRAAIRSTQILMAVVGVGSMVAVLAVLAVYLGLRRHILSRLQNLTGALRDWRSGREAHLPRDSRNDEISELSDTVRDLVATANKHSAELTRQALTDPLTGLLNRRGFEERGLDEVARSARYGQPLTVLFGDIDLFKVVNDTHGHAVGDAALRHTASLWRGTLRDIDICGRLGGEEFAVLLPHTSIEEAIRVADRIRDDIAHNALVLNDGSFLSMTISIGAAQLQPDEMLDGLLSRADAALYAAKAAGRNRVMAAQKDQNFSETGQGG